MLTYFIGGEREGQEMGGSGGGSRGEVNEIITILFCIHL